MKLFDLESSLQSRGGSVLGLDHVNTMLRERRQMVIEVAKYRNTCTLQAGFYNYTLQNVLFKKLFHTFKYIAVYVK